MSSLIERWRALDARPFPAEASAGKVNGVNLRFVESFAAGVVERFLTGRELEWSDLSLMLQHRAQLARALPALSPDAQTYFGELDAIMARVIGDAATDLYKFTNVTGVELSQLLARRAEERLASLPSHEHFQAMLGAGLIVVANTLRGPVMAAVDQHQAAEKMVQLAADWLRKLLEPSVSGGVAK